MSQRRSSRAKKSPETKASRNDVLDASAPAPMLSPPPPVVIGASLSIADELALVDAAWDEMLA